MPGKLQGHKSSMGIMYLDCPAHTGDIALYHLPGGAAARPAFPAEPITVAYVTPRPHLRLPTSSAASLQAAVGRDS
ncbi:hypothetical protein CEP54_007083 [Fusarium duplospermum]|uniref:Uncharacterized protein n=1 Tax=Fusarium duplospermum TaxID=1325734 RepID=A0A428Q3H2_9HYPO|nr:hypothetical protein CEP54_007083 [Fusarium duplospermum]